MGKVKAVGWFMLALLGFLVGVPFGLRALSIAFLSGECGVGWMPWDVPLPWEWNCGQIETLIAFVTIGGGVGAGRNGVGAWQS